MHKVADSVRYILDTYGKPVPMDKRGAFIALCLARALSVDLQLPTSPVTSIQVFYGSTVYAKVNEVVSAFNEAYVIDTKLVMDLVYKHYKLRYALVYDPVAAIPLFMGRDVTEELVPTDLLEICRASASSELVDAFRMLMRSMRTEMNDGDTLPPIAGGTAGLKTVA